MVSMTISSCNRYLVVADCSSNIVLWEHLKNKWNEYCKLPRYNSAPTSVSIQPKRLFLVVAYADQKVNVKLT